MKNTKDMKKTNVPLLAFLAWMATLLCICAITNRSLAQDCYDAFPDHLKTRTQAATIASAVNMAKSIVQNNVHNTTVDSPTAYLTTREEFDLSIKAMVYASCLLETFTYMTDAQIEVATGAAGYERAMEWALTSNNFGKIALPAPLLD